MEGGGGGFQGHQTPFQAFQVALDAATSPSLPNGANEQRLVNICDEALPGPGKHM